MAEVEELASRACRKVVVVVGAEPATDVTGRKITDDLVSVKEKRECTDGGAKCA